MAITSPVELSMPLLRASYMPLSDSDMNTEMLSLYLFTISIVPSLDPPSTTIYSIFG